jgi:hypothetical protein
VPSSPADERGDGGGCAENFRMRARPKLGYLGALLCRCFYEIMLVSEVKYWKKSLDMAWKVGAKW